ncbi:hypothetical protein [Clostridium tetani]|uniref:hypothetical protein n=1 Tax=Clostridium tetani TaxID=1513 RepID=UPI000513DADC|nr:hypothetical protein [Clostridium tetani]KGI42934.1 hypothetical protein KY55_08450 [Clostridium tetani]RXI67789.1 hypothetical protein DP127_14020 [Clostridium tetani]BDR77008.1 hypothetical protein K154306013_p10590 [Clostridium tetani]BDR88140.1 hypothetical protein N071400001_p10750 [Clostridium tetani]
MVSLFILGYIYNGGVLTSSSWFRGICYKAWNYVTHFYDYMKASGYTYGNDDVLEARIGNVSQFYRDGS